MLRLLGDSACFCGSINRNFEAMVDALPITREHLKTLALNSFEASFVGSEVKAAFVAKVRTFFAQNP
jgi:adenine deaminase